MCDIAVRVENLSKRYRIGLVEEKQDTLGGAVVDALRRPLQNLQRLRRLSKFREDGLEPEDIIWALKGVSFEVRKGEVVGIIGRNGAGKTTLLKILSRITEPTKGRAVVRGGVGSLLEVGTGFHTELTGRENIYLNGTILGMKKAEVDRKFDEIVDFSGVEKFIDTPVKRYSSGMKVRLAFAVAAHLEPEILLIDEVLAVGDADFQRKCLGKMNKIAGEGRTVLFVSHNMMAIESLCQRAIVLNHGEIVFEGDTDEAVSYYRDQKEWIPKASVNLGKHPGRTKNSISIFQRVRILNHNEEETAEFRIGDSIIFEMKFNTRKRNLNSPRIQINIRSGLDIPVCRLVSDIMGTEPLTIPEEGMVRCYWDRCFLVAGIYSINLHLKNGGMSVDKIVNALSFEVLPTDVYGTGKLDSGASIVVPTGKWESREISD